MVDYILPFLLLLLFIFTLGKKLNAFELFLDGAKKAVNVCLNMFPYFVAIFMAVQLLRISGVAEWLSKLMSPIFAFIGIPAELVELTLLRPFSGSGSLALVDDIFKEYGADSYVGRCASILMGSTETVFYLTATYFAATKVKRLRYALPVGLICCLIGAVISCLVCKIM